MTQFPLCSAHPKEVDIRADILWNVKEGFVGQVSFELSW
jgi:hypothetical protein